MREKFFKTAFRISEWNMTLEVIRMTCPSFIGDTTEANRVEETCPESQNQTRPVPLGFPVPGMTFSLYAAMHWDLLHNSPI